jgi:hypothetical protein
VTSRRLRFKIKLSALAFALELKFLVDEFAANLNILSSRVFLNLIQSTARSENSHRSLHRFFFLLAAHLAGFSSDLPQIFWRDLPTRLADVLVRPAHHQRRMSQPS